MTVAIGEAGERDLHAIRSVVDAEEPPPVADEGGHPEAIDAYYLHLIRRGRVLIAFGDDGAAAGFGAVIDSGRSLHLADLFVRREHQGQGIGRRLLAGLFEDRWPRTTFLVASSSGAASHDATLAAVRWSAPPDGRIGMCIPGPHPLLPTLLAADFRVVDRDTYQASDPGLIDPVRVIVNTGIL